MCVLLRFNRCMFKTEPIVISPTVVDGLHMILTRLADDTPALRRPSDITQSVDREFITPRLLTAVQAGEFLGVDQTTVRELWRDGKLKCVRIGRGGRCRLWNFGATSKRMSSLTTIAECIAGVGRINPTVALWSLPTFWPHRCGRNGRVEVSPGRKWQGVQQIFL